MQFISHSWVLGAGDRWNVTAPFKSGCTRFFRTQAGDETVYTWLSSLDV